MWSSSTLSVLLSSAIIGQATAQAGSPVTGALGNATFTVNNPPGVVYTASLPSTAFDKEAYPSGGNIRGFVSAKSSPNGIGVKFHVEFSNLPRSGGPFIYHIHQAPVPADGDCDATLAHLDPFQRGEVPKCDASLPQTCQVGDLSGKHGNITSDPFTEDYTDNFVSTSPQSAAYFGNLSLVVHFANTTRITCASFAPGTGTSSSDTNGEVSNSGLVSQTGGTATDSAEGPSAAVVVAASASTTSIAAFLALASGALAAIVAFNL